MTNRENGLRSIIGFHRGGADFDEGHLTYQAAGVRGPAVVLLHGASLDNGSITWRRVAEDLVADHRVFSPDLPKHGDSWPWRARADQEALEDVVIRLMDHWRLSSATLIGLSMGATVSLGTALRAPDRVERLVLASCGGIHDRVRAHELAYLSLRTPISWALTSMQKAKSLETFARTQLPYSEDVTEAEIDWLAAAYVAEYESKRRHGGHLFSDWNRFEIGPRRMRTNHMPRLSELSCPTLFIHGEDDDAVPLRLAHDAANRVPQGQLETVRGAGHFLAQDHPREVAQIVRSFLTATDQS
ncbi:alpha/beta fold hydrolase [Sciscionella marina]|uniref:alpha/beta fold hydrolase n=1 Tax=Sciscionella marina TaxID=508770 RepID=UPI00035E2761|nr:alpha/beta hydrolase [Sciscionella marina]